MLPNISSNGYVVRKDVCIEEGPAGRFDESTQCLDYGPPIYAPVGKELRDNFVNYGTSSFFTVLIIGLFLMNGTRIEENKNRRIINFIRYISAHKEIGDGAGECDRFCRELDKGKSVNELLERDRYGFGNSIVVAHISENKYQIKFEWEEKGGGDGGEWDVTFDKANNVVECIPVERWLS